MEQKHSVLSRRERRGISSNRTAVNSQNVLRNDNRQIRERSIDLGDIWTVVRKHLVLFIIIILVCAVGYGFGRSYVDPPKYASNATIFLTPRFDEDGDLDQSSISTNRTLLNNAIALMTRENIMSQVSEQIGNMTPEEIQKTLTVEAVSGTELISISSETTDPQLSKRIVDATVNAFIETMQENLNLDNITIVDQPKLNFESQSTPIAVYMLQGGAVGLVIDVLLTALWVLFDKRLRTKEEAEKYLGVPVYAVLPDLEHK